MWRAIGASAQGTSHIAGNLPCQDACGHCRAYLGGEPVTILVIADGAGSAKASELGSRECVAHLLHTEIDEGLAMCWLASARSHLEAVAVENSLSPRDLSCTALFAVLGESESIFVQLGDGAWVAEYRGKCEPITWPATGEYANETTFLNSPKWKEAAQFRRWSESAMSVAGFTDGLQGLALHFATRAVHVPFFAPMFDALQRTDDEASLHVPLLDFLNSPLVNERTDDDKTLVLARRDKLRLQDGSD
jgi:hypothetical protein